MYIDGKRQCVKCYIYIVSYFCENCVYPGECAKYFAGITSTLLPISAYMYIDNMTIISVKNMIIAWPTGVQLVFFLLLRIFSKLFGAQGSPSSGSLLNL